MSNYKGVLHETVVKFPCTEIWIDSCGDKELDYGIERGISGATSNPINVLPVLKDEQDYWKPIIEGFIAENPTASEDDIAWMF